ncbi:hypothetical protein J6590_060622 [Homalodisca vitripennis]|nr:hypothetical protein J6590_060622 [Homalodisca vitripennis]
MPKLQRSLIRWGSGEEKFPGGLRCRGPILTSVGRHFSINPITVVSHYKSTWTYILAAHNWADKESTKSESISDDFRLSDSRPVLMNVLTRRAAPRLRPPRDHGYGTRRAVPTLGRPTVVLLEDPSIQTLRGHCSEFQSSKRSGIIFLMVILAPITSWNVGDSVT